VGACTPREIRVDSYEPSVCFENPQRPIRSLKRLWLRIGFHFGSMVRKMRWTSCASSARRSQSKAQSACPSPIASRGECLAVFAAEPACLDKGFERAAVFLQLHVGLGELEVSDPKLRIDNDGLTCISNCPVSISRGKVDLGSESAIHRTEGI